MTPIDFGVSRSNVIVTWSIKYLSVHLLETIKLRDIIICVLVGHGP